MMLGTMANMVTRELEGGAGQLDLGEYLVCGQAVPPELRSKLDAYNWTTLLLDTATRGWRILYANHAFRTMTGDLLATRHLPCQCLLVPLGLC